MGFSGNIIEGLAFIVQGIVGSGNCSLSLLWAMLGAIRLGNGAKVSHSFVINGQR